MSTGTYMLRRRRQDGTPAEIEPRYSDPAEARAAAELLRQTGDTTIEVVVVPAAELEASPLSA